MTETTGEIKLTKRPFEENAYKYADEQAVLYRGLKEPGGGYANIVDAYIAGAKIETAELKKKNAELKRIVKMVAMINKGIYTPVGIKAIYAEAEKIIKEE